VYVSISLLATATQLLAESHVIACKAVASVGMTSGVQVPPPSEVAYAMAPPPLPLAPPTATHSDVEGQEIELK